MALYTEGGTYSVRQLFTHLGLLRNAALESDFGTFQLHSHRLATKSNLDINTAPEGLWRRSFLLNWGVPGMNSGMNAGVLKLL